MASDDLWTTDTSADTLRERHAAERAYRREESVKEWSRSQDTSRAFAPGEGERRSEGRVEAAAADRSGRSLDGEGRKLALRRTLHEFTDDGCTDMAAGLTYYGVLSIFPALIAMVSLLGVFGQGQATTDAFLQIGRDLGAPSEQLGFVESYIQNQQSSSGAGLGLAIGILGALWSASNYVNAFSRMMNRIYEVPEGRPVWKLRPWMVLVTAVVLLMVMAVGLSFVLTGPVAESVFGVIGLGDEATMVWAWAKWPAAALMVILIFRLLYWATPNAKLPQRILTPGAVMAFVVWVLASAAFAGYLAFGGNYDATYGALAGVIIFLLWLWLTNTVLLLGAEYDAESERVRELREGAHAEQNLVVELRDSSGAVKSSQKEANLIQEATEYRLDSQVATRL